MVYPTHSLALAGFGVLLILRCPSLYFHTNTCLTSKCQLLCFVLRVSSGPVASGELTPRPYESALARKLVGLGAEIPQFPGPSGRITLRYVPYLSFQSLLSRVTL